MAQVPRRPRTQAFYCMFSKLYPSGVTDTPFPQDGVRRCRRQAGPCVGPPPGSGLMKAPDCPGGLLMGGHEAVMLQGAWAPEGCWECGSVESFTSFSRLSCLSSECLRWPKAGSW